MRISSSIFTRARLCVVLLAVALPLILASRSASATTLPSVTFLAPASGPVAGGTSVSISGSGFNGLLAVTFGGVPSSTIAFFNDGLVTAVAPPHAAGTVDVSVVTGAGGSAATAADRFTYNSSAPVVTSVSPGSGPTSGGTFVNITGSGFTSAMVVTFGGVGGAGLVVANDDSLTVFSPAHAAGTVAVTVWANGIPSGPSFVSQFTYGSGIAVTGLSPEAGPVAGGNVVTVSGVGLSGVTAVSFGDTFANILSVSDTALLVQAPPHAPGSVHVLVWFGETSSTPGTADIYTFVGGEIVTSLTPSGGPSSGGTLVDVEGAGFTGALTVTFGGVSGSGLTILSDNELTIVSPPHEAGTVHVVVWGGGTFSPLSPADQFTYSTALAVTAVSPSAGPTTGGTAVSLTGTAFTGATAVLFGGIAGSNPTVIDDSHITVVTPAHAAGAVNVVVTVGSASSTPTDAAVFTYAAVSSGSPPARFTGAVTLNGNPAPDGTAVQAFVGDASCGSTTTFTSSGQSRYVLDSPASDAAAGCGLDGSVVAFRVGGLAAAQTGAWHNYQLNQLDLAAGTAPTTVPTTPVPTTPAPPAPAPPNTGSGVPQGGETSGGTVWMLLAALAGIAAAGIGAGGGLALRRGNLTTAPASASLREEQPAPHSDCGPSVVSSTRHGARTYAAAATLAAAGLITASLLASRRRGQR